MEDSLGEAFTGYTELVQAILRNHSRFDEQLGALVIPTLSRNRRITYLPMVIEKVEGRGNFFSSSLRQGLRFATNITHLMVTGQRSCTEFLSQIRLLS
jgi:hypothetical protein